MLTKEEFQNLLTGGPLLLDGATGSNLQKAGMPKGCCTEEWVLTHPEALVKLQRATRRQVPISFMPRLFRRSPSRWSGWDFSAGARKSMPHWWA